ncbi:hypothetical protein Ctob_013269 [Chrysochromulina tobinii]|uniref:Uncharacterized protein n=1 Tax=Chrysochromulina tobinii TaxID=1460289 RepID=A0A0M0LPH4_9EUKA|nr:hypothetical protein Ctob_013269 [Chrysochromulina tobinii]|eukprot:KOO52911.1 hypothetical protein Ctob_013269 [Chrysochromulina sp. CCMP291]
MQAQGRPKLLQDLKAAGVSSLTDRQALCGAISKAVKAGELHAVASHDGRRGSAAGLCGGTR